MVGLAGHGPSGSRRAFTGNCYGITVGISIISGRHTSSPRTNADPTTAYIDTSPAAATNGDTDPTHARAPNAGASTNHSGATRPTGPNTNTTYSADTRGTDHTGNVSDNADIPSPDAHATTLSSNVDAATSLRS